MQYFSSRSPHVTRRGYHTFVSLALLASKGLLLKAALRICESLDLMLQVSFWRTWQVFPIKGVSKDYDSKATMRVWGMAVFGCFSISRELN